MTRTDQTTVLVTGGAGYVGCHCVLQLLEQDYGVIVIDNCSNAHKDQIDANGNIVELPESLRRVEELTSKKLLAFYEFDLVDQENQRQFDEIFRKYNIRVVLHFAAFKSVNESIERPLDYYNNNLVGTINLLNAMRRHGCKQMIFSSSATVYGLPQYLPVDEQHQVGQNILNPYGRTKFMIEQILMDLSAGKVNNDGSSGQWNIISLRYFNPVGAHPSGFIGEHTQGIPNNLMPYVSQVSIKKRDKLYVFGDDFDTPDGTGVRDFIHIMDLASGHLSALKFLLEHQNGTHPSSSKNNGNGETKSQNNYKVYNLGTGKGYSVLEIIKTFEAVNDVEIPYEIAPRRQGDAGSVYADASLALKELGWKAKYSITEMVRDVYKWQSEHPQGFKVHLRGPSRGFYLQARKYTLVTFIRNKTCCSFSPVYHSHRQLPQLNKLLTKVAHIDFPDSYTQAIYGTSQPGNMSESVWKTKTGSAKTAAVYKLPTGQQPLSTTRYTLSDGYCPPSGVDGFEILEPRSTCAAQFPSIGPSCRVAITVLHTQ